MGGLFMRRGETCLANRKERKGVFRLTPVDLNTSSVDLLKHESARGYGGGNFGRWLL